MISSIICSNDDEVRRLSSQVSEPELQDAETGEST